MHIFTNHKGSDVSAVGTGRHIFHIFNFEIFVTYSYHCKLTDQIDETKIISYFVVRLKHRNLLIIM